MNSYRDLVNKLENISNGTSVITEDESSAENNLRHGLMKWAEILEQDLLEQAQADLDESMSEFDSEEEYREAVERLQEEWSGTTIAVLCTAILNALEWR